MIRTFLDCSTAHVSFETAEWLAEIGQLNASGDGDGGQFAISSTHYGWFLHVGKIDGMPEPAATDLAPIFEKARAAGADYVMLDRDADKLDGLPVFDW